MVAVIRTAEPCLWAFDRGDVSGPLRSHPRADAELLAALVCCLLFLHSWLGP